MKAYYCFAPPAGHVEVYVEHPSYIYSINRWSVLSVHDVF